jgi:type IV pilus assembly protein PilM
MIKNVLLPEKIGSYYLFSKRILGFDIGKTHVHACQVLISGRSITLEKVFQETLETGNQSSYQEKVSKAIDTIVRQAHKKCEIRTALSSALVVFKTLKLPFVDREKIAMVIGYEIEPLLPFSLADALIDFIITKENKEEQSSEILVAAVQKNYVIQHMEPFLQAGVSPAKISVDLFDLYALFKQIPSYTHKQGGIALIDMGFTATRIAYIHDGQLRMIRTLSKGISRFIKQLSEQLDMSIADALDKLMRFGLGPSDNSAYTETITEIMGGFLQEIQFTLQSFATKDTTNITSIMLLGGGANIKDIEVFFTKFTGISCEQFSIQELFGAGIIKNKTKNNLGLSHVQSLATALPSPLTEDINLRKKELALSDERTFIQQVIVGVILLCSLFGVLVGHYWWQTSKLSAELSESKQEIIDTLKQHFKIPKDETDLDDIIETAEKEVQKAEQMWFAFSSQARSSFLKYLLALHALDKEGLGLNVEQITINEGTLVLKAQVKDYEALKKLEKDLRQSKLFSYVEPQEKTDFTMRITLVKNGEE